MFSSILFLNLYSCNHRVNYELRLRVSQGECEYFAITGSLLTSYRKELNHPSFIGYAVRIGCRQTSKVKPESGYRLPYSDFRYWRHNQ
jgi:hypothetical protein